MNPFPIFSRTATTLILAGGMIAFAPSSTLAAETAAIGAPPPTTTKATAPTPPAPRVRPDFWSMLFVAPTPFNNQGVESYRHHTMISRKLRFKGADETEVGYAVYLPPGYENSDARYPILYFLAGNGGNAGGSWPVVTKAHELIAKGELPPFIVVGITGGRSFYGNQFEGKCQVYDFFFEEFLPHIEKTYRTKTEARYRHIQGESAGGNGAMMYALKHPELFGTVTAVAGAFRGVRVNAWAEMYGSRQENHQPFDCYSLLLENQPRRAGLRIALWVGSADITIGDNTQMHRLLTERSIAHTYNDQNSRPQLAGVPHRLERYYERYGKEILQFHAEAFGP